MFWIIFVWLTLQFILIGSLNLFRINVPSSIFYFFTLFIVIPFSLIGAHLISARSLLNKKGKFTNALFGITTILDIFFIITVPSLMSRIPAIISAETKATLDPTIPENSRKDFLSRITKISTYTTKIINAEPDLISGSEWKMISSFWNIYARSIKDGKITKSEMKTLEKIYSKILGQEEKNGKNKPHRNSSEGRGYTGGVTGTSKSKKNR